MWHISRCLSFCWPMFGYCVDVDEWMWWLMRRHSYQTRFSVISEICLIMSKSDWKWRSEGLAYIQILCSYAQMKFCFFVWVFLFGAGAFGQWYLTNIAPTLSGVHKRKHPVTFLCRILGDIHLLNSSNTLHQKWQIKALTQWPCLLAGSACAIYFRWTRSTFIVW